MSKEKREKLKEKLENAELVKQLGETLQSKRSKIVTCSNIVERMRQNRSSAKQKDDTSKSIQMKKVIRDDDLRVVKQFSGEIDIMDINDHQGRPFSILNQTLDMKSGPSLTTENFQRQARNRNQIMLSQTISLYSNLNLPSSGF